jgi:hypothetical protein
VFSEQPIALWALDDTVDYISLVPPESQNLSSWSPVGCTVVNAKTHVSFQSDRPPKEPFNNLYVSGINEVLENNGVFSFVSDVELQPEDINSDLGSFAINAYFFTYDRVVDIKLGYVYTDPESLQRIPVNRELKNIPAERQWASVSQTFALPESFLDLNFTIGVSFTESEAPYQLAINGINVGQWAEEFHLESPGVIPAPIPDSIALDSNGIPAFSYGFDGSRGYYLSSNNKLHAKNAGLPLVYGAFNSTVISPNIKNPELPYESDPSLIIPGFGFLNESGRYKSFTFEFWAKIQSNTFQPRRIFGPISSEDGLYVEGPFLKIRAGRASGSHYVGEWDRPMLIDIRVTPSEIALILNGEVVIEEELFESDFFIEKFSEENKDQDWLGFYAYTDVPLIQIDCAGIYPYEVPAVVAKRRFVYGQAVEIPNNIRGLNNSSTIFMDGAFAKNSKNYSYPLVGRWEKGFIENILPEVRSLSFPDYQLPLINFNNQTVEQWYEDVSEIDSSDYESVTLKPNADWNNTDGYVLFESLNLLLEETKCFYGVFSLSSLSSEKQILFNLVNDRTGNSFSIFLEDGTVKYALNTKSPNGSVVEEILYESSDHVTDAIFLAGLHIPRFISSVGNRASSFFGSKQDIKVFVGGNRNFTETFKHKIYSVGFCTRNNLQKIEDEFLLTGLPVNFSENYTEIIVYDGGPVSPDPESTLAISGDPTTSEWDIEADANGLFLLATDLVGHTASYTFIAKRELENLTVDIGVDSYWEDYIPLSYFSKYVVDGQYKTYKTLDFLQFNIDYPRFDVFSSEKYNSANSPLKMYATFQYLQNGSNKAFSSFSETELLSREGVVVPGQNWENTRYEITDDTIIYPPAGISLDSLSINFHLQIVLNGILSNPITIRSLRVSSQALGFSPNRIGNRFGAEMYPFRKVGNYFDYKSVSPFSVYKNTAPYLFLASNSGIRIRDNYATFDNRGLEIPINKNSAAFFKIGSFQMALRYDEPLFPEAPVQIFEIQDKEKILRFYLVSYPGNRARGYIYAIRNNTAVGRGSVALESNPGEPTRGLVYDINNDNNNGSLESGIIYNTDGKMVKKPTLNSKLWTVLGFSFENALDMSDFAGALRITNPLLIDNISYYQITEEDEAERFAFRKWYAVKSEPDNPLDWQYWKDLEKPDPNNPEEFIDYAWRDVLFLTQSEPRVIDPSVIYKQYTGTDRVIFSSDDSLMFSNYKYSFFKDLRWNRIILDSA